MKTTNNNNERMELLKEMIERNEEVLSVCNKEIEYITHPEVYGFCIEAYNSIVVNKERLMCVKLDEENRTSYEFTPTYPTYFTPSAARRIVKDAEYFDINNNRIPMEIVSRLEYYKLLKERTENTLKVLQSVI